MFSFLKMGFSNFKKFFSIFIIAMFDLFLLLFFLIISIIIRIKIAPLFFSNLPFFNHPFKRYLWFVGVHFGIMIYEGAYSKRLTFWDEVKLLWKSTTLTGIVVAVILFISKQAFAYSRLVILTWLFFNFISFPIFRTKIKKILYKFRLGKEKVLIIGKTENGIKFVKAIEAEPNLGYEVVGFIDDKTELKDIEEIQTIVISDPNMRSKKIFQLFSQNPTKFRTIFYIPEVKQIPVIGTEIRYFFQEDIFALELKNNLANPLNYFLKRAIDYLITLILLPLIMPLFIFIALLVKITSKGPIIFSHERVGKGGKIFKCYKFRTMYIDAEEKLKQILETNPEVKVEWETKYKLTNDPRVTPIGKFLRKTSLDELPQIFNVLKGEMSLIGPRPVTKEELDKYYKEKAELYCLIPPGITGLWQVSGRSNLTYEERVNLDCWYIRNWSLWLDLVILLKTVKVVLKGEGAC
jgi:Undecaprenyl-phosphate galactose phosphotransferase WbaP